MRRPVPSRLKNRGVGWDAQTVEVIIDLGSLRNITEVSVHAISDPTSQIVFPAQIEVSTSKDKSQWEKAASPITYSDSNGKSDAWGKTDFSNVACRYVKSDSQIFSFHQYDDAHRRNQGNGRIS